MRHCKAYERQHQHMERRFVLEKRREPFRFSRRAAVIAASLAFVVIVLAAAIVFSTSAIARKTAIGEEKAENFAFADLGMDPLSAEGVRTEFGFEQGQFVYKVYFMADGTEYEYWIKASDGSVVKKGMDLVAKGESLEKEMSSITLESAKEAALSDAGVERSEAVFTKAKLEAADAGSVYDIEFYTSNAIYEYEILEHTGAIYSKSKEAYLADGTGDPGQKAQAEEPGGAKTAEKNRQGNSMADGTESLEKEMQGSTAAGGTEASGTEAQGGAAAEASAGSARAEEPGDGQISLEEAKGIVLADAGIANGDVTFTKAKLDYEDGIAVYDIEFYTAAYEYEYEVNASTGGIRSKDKEILEDREDFGDAGMSGNTERPGTAENPGNTVSEISVDQAKYIAASHAGFPVSDVDFSKVKLEKEDGMVIYEIEFYRNGIEYEYEINAITGEILKYDSEQEEE